MNDKYFSYVLLEDKILESEFSHIRLFLLELHIGFIFQKSSECIFNIVREFYTNRKIDVCAKYITMRVLEVPQTRIILNIILGTF